MLKTLTIIICTAVSVLVKATPILAEDGGPETSFTLADTRTTLSGQWRGTLDYRDYQADRWFGIPVTVDMELIDDGVTVVRKSSYDDGPARGMVYITTVSLLSADGQTEYVGSFRADRPAELGRYEVRLGDPRETPFSANNWVVVAERDGRDDNRPARIRETTTRSGNSLITLKEVDFTDDQEQQWVSRNRSVLEKQVPQQSLRIRIEGFECGDNCYLDYRPLGPDGQPTGEIQSALCSVGACEGWFAEQEMPAAMIGRKASASIGIGKQYDNAGNVMSDDFPEITELQLDP